MKKADLIKTFREMARNARDLYYIYRETDPKMAESSKGEWLAYWTTAQMLENDELAKKMYKLYIDLDEQ